MVRTSSLFNCLPTPLARKAFAALLLLVLVLAGMSLPAAAAEPIRVHGYKMAGDASRVRIVLQMEREPQLRWTLMRGPHRLVLDLQGTTLALDPADAAPRGLVTGVRFGQLEAGTSRLILATKGPFRVEGLDVIANESSPGHRLVADLVAASETEFETALAEQIAVTGSTVTAKGDRVVSAGEPAAKPFTIVIDPGHGGIDSGAEGIGGTLEKAVTLNFASELRNRLAQDPKIRVHLTRDDDTFLRLDERVRIARQYGADLFISVHADTIKYKGIRGATVYTVSDQASDADAAALAARENLSDELAGMAVEDADHAVSDILMDLVRRETHAFSIRFARSLLGELSEQVEMIKNPHRFAGFKVLKAPDVPSVLLELGYLSNKDDEQQLQSAEWRAKAIGGIAEAIMEFAGPRLRTGG
ncbi:MAG: N-acetylmuramoyl-L-alanine amidase [Rhizobiaceae bacterium]|nr:N-acetylmuramoyl-L-alanine amidase [Rhizobiaceae bacterium]